MLTTGKRIRKAAVITQTRKDVNLIMDLRNEFDCRNFSEDGFIKV